MSQSQLDHIYETFLEGIYGQDCDAKAIIISTNHLSASETLAIYRGSVRGNLIQALGDIYPAVKRCVGDEFFEAMAGRFVSQFPSRSPSLDDYGEELADFMMSFPPLKELPYIPDLARVEWAWHRAFHAPDETMLDASLLQALTPEEQMSCSFNLNQSIRLISSPYPISQIWKMNKGLEPIAEINLDQGEENLLVWRKGYDTRVDVVTPLEHSFLIQLKKGQTLGTIYEDMLSKEANNEDLVSALTSILSSGWLTGFKRD